MAYPSNRNGLSVRWPALLGSLLAFAATCIGPPLQAEEVDAGAATGKRVLYLFNQTKLEKAASATPRDQKRVAQLELWRRNDEDAMRYLASLGFRVSRASEATPATAVDGQDLVVISESVDAIDVDPKYRQVPVPLLTFENDLLGVLGMTDLKNGRDYGTEEEQRFLWVVNAPHPLAGGVGAGIRNVLMDEHCKVNWGRPGPGAIIVATVLGEPDKAALFAYERGATMNGDFLAPARRVSFFLWQDTFGQLRPEGMAMFRAAVLWAVSPSR